MVEEAQAGVIRYIYIEWLVEWKESQQKIEENDMLLCSTLF